jgi:hypothetical protein
MRKIVSYTVFTFLIMVIGNSCKKEGTSKTSEKAVEITIKTNQDYQYELGNFGDEEGARISLQAAHYSISEVHRDSDHTRVFYVYHPAAGYTGTDEVELRSERGSDGGSPNDKITITKIKFVISN